MLNTETHWQEACHQLSQKGQPYVLITLLGSAGSTPRIAGTKMVVTSIAQFDTIGGGHLEYKVIEEARRQLESKEPKQDIKHFPLGATLGQCCGGSVSVLFEVIISKQLHLDIYGAGHIANHLIQILEKLPIAVRWIDSRADLFPDKTTVQTRVTDDPVSEVKLATPGSAFLVLTHNHQLDFDLCQTILTHWPTSWLGVIGSETKADRFRKRLSHRGIDPTLIDHMVCPVGLPQVSGKAPMEVAVSIAGQLIALYQSNEKTQYNRKGIHWQTLKALMLNEVMTKQ